MAGKYPHFKSIEGNPPLAPGLWSNQRKFVSALKPRRGITDRRCGRAGSAGASAHAPATAGISGAPEPQLGIQRANLVATRNSLKRPKL